MLRVGMALRFVVLHHTGVAEPHFDLLIEVPGSNELMTWRIGTGPGEWAGADAVGAVRIADHRVLYMNYEGEISGGRGEVKRVAAGQTKVVEADDSRVTLAEMGEREKAWRITLPLGHDLS